MKNQKMMQRIQKNMRGSFMTEYGLVLILVLLALVGVIGLFSSNSIATQTDQLSGDMTTLMGKVKASYANNYSQVTNARLDTGGFFKGLTSLNNNAGAVTTNLGGGTLTISGGTVTTANDSVQYVLTQVPDDACLPFTTAMAKSTTKFSIGANVVKAVGAKPDPSKVICADDNNTITILVQ